MQRGRRYARTGQVVTLDVQAATIAAQVQGSRPRPYVVTVSLLEPTAAQWDVVIAEMTATIGFVARLLDGEVPPELDAVFERAGIALLPRAWRDLRTACSCPDQGAQRDTLQRYAQIFHENEGDGEDQRNGYGDHQTGAHAEADEADHQNDRNASTEPCEAPTPL